MNMLAIVPTDAVYVYHNPRQHITHVSKELVRFQDPRPVRLILGFASLLWAIFSWINPATFNLPVYSFLKSFGNHNSWWIASWPWFFFSHFILVVWQIYDPKYRQRIALAVNSYGLFIWSFYTVSLNISSTGPTSGTSSEWALCAAAAWALYTNDIIRRIPNVAAVVLVPEVVMQD